MTQPTSSPPLVSDLQKGDKLRDVVFLVETSNFKQTRNQKYFIQMILRDRTGSLRGVRWEATEELYRSFGVDDFVRVDGRVEEFQGSLQLVVDRIEPEPAENVDFSNFLPVSDRPVEEMLDELHCALGEIKRPELRKLLNLLVTDPEIRPALMRCPAGKTLHHAYLGGLLEHICSLIGAARELCKHYAGLDRDLLYAAAIIHDLGKIEELSFTRNFGYTTKGQLLGHIAIGMMLTQEKAALVPELSRDLLIEIQHIIASHHGIPEYGAVKLPMTREAIVFHYLDNLDAKLATLDAIENEPRPDGDAWSDYKPHLSRKIYFPPRGENSGG